MRNICFTSLFLGGIFFNTGVQAEIIKVGAAAYTTDLPAGRRPPSDDNNDPTFPKVTSEFNQVPTTNEWWSSLIWESNPGSQWSENIFAHPMSHRARATGLEVGYPNKYYVTPYQKGSKYNTQEYHYAHTKDLTLTIPGLNTQITKVKSYTDWTVTSEWKSGSQTLNTTIGKGIPFVYVNQSGGDAVVAVVGSPTVWQNADGVVGLTINGHHYGLFAPAGSTWTRNGNNLQSTLKGLGYYSVAILPDNKPETLEFFRKRAYAFVTDSKVTWNYDEATSTVTTNYALTTTLKEAGPNNSNVNKTLMGLYRHQWKNTSSAFTAYTYVSPRGSMKVLDGNQFTTKLKFPGLLPYLPNVAQDGINSYKASTLYGYIDTLFKQTKAARWQNTGEGTDTYWTGKNLMRIAHLIPIAEQVKHTAARDLFLAELKGYLQSWFDGTTKNLFYYDNNWKTLIGYPASFGSDVNLSDHHFHYGYYIYAAAIVAQYDPAWASDSQWGGFVKMLIKDVDNWDKTDKRFPFLRYFDVYSGHSWANGPAYFGAGNNQESSSEDINCVAGIMLWGALTGDKAIRDLGIYLYTTNISSIPQYWFDVENTVFPTDFKPNTIGILWGNGGAYSIWWNGTVQELHGINFTPIQPGMLFMSKYPEYLKENKAFMMGNYGNDSPNTWKEIHMGVRAMYDAPGAIADFNSNPNYTQEAGDTRSHTYHWIHNLNQLGTVDDSVTANIPTYGVFIKNGARTYVAYNPTAAAVTAKFSDGVSLVVPARSIATSQGVAPPEHEFTEDSQDFGQVVFSFRPNWDTASVKLNYKLNGGVLNTLTMVKKDGIWQVTVSGLKSGDKVDYYYSYEDNGATVNTDSSQHVYKCTAGENPPEQPNVIDDNANYTLKGEASSNSLKVSFTVKQPTQFVDLHYTVNGGGQMNYRMSNSGNTWTYTIPRLKDKDAVNIWLTYTVAGAGRDTKKYPYAFAGATTSLLEVDSRSKSSPGQ